ncbi:hypothetical protein FACS1894219_04300 [Clostridia bacterium]|nr:hypothetical protein FACS1894219_04300 [Clostridia bacterium]
MLSDKIDAVMEAVGIKNVALANATGYDPSLISKYRKGTRDALRYETVKSLCAALASLTPEDFDGEDLPDKLREIAGPWPMERGRFSDALFMWFTEETMLLRPAIKYDSSSLKIFGEKLTELMSVAKLTNIQLAKSLSVDASLVARYKSGVRFPSERGAAVPAIAACIVRNIKDEQKKQEIAEIVGGESGDLTARVLAWLSEMPESREDTSGIESFLESVDSYRYRVKQPVLPMITLKPFAGDGKADRSFHGVKGMRQAILRALYYTAQKDKPTTLYLTSTCSMEYLNDKLFVAQWASLMVHCLAKGHTMKIIYNIADRDIDETMTAIQSFVPLYMIGNIEPYWFKTDEKSVFRVTWFVIENLAAISSVCTLDMDEDAVFDYTTDPERVAMLTTQFKGLFKYSGELMRIYRQQTGMEGYDVRLASFWRAPGDMSVLIPSLSLATMPEELLTKILSRTDTDRETSGRIKEAFSRREQWLMRQVVQGGLTEYTVIADTARLQAGEVFVDIPAYLYDKPIAYTPDEYAAHLAYIRQLERKMQDYRLGELPMSPFANIKVMYKKDVLTVVEKMGTPAAAFAFDNPFMCNGFEGFFAELEKRARFLYVSI